MSRVSVAIADHMTHLVDGGGSTDTSLFFTKVDDASQGEIVGADLQYALTQRLDESDHVFGQLFFHIAIADLAAVLEIVKIVDSVL